MSGPEQDRAFRPHILGLRSRFIIFVLAGVGLVSALMAWVSFRESRDALLELRQEELFDLARGQAAVVSRQLAMVSQPTMALARVLEVMQPRNRAELVRLLRRQVVGSRHIFGMAAAYAPHAFYPTRRRFCPYVFRSPRGIQVSSLAGEDYNYPRWDWYLIPYLLARPVWSEPYFDQGGGGALMTTYSAPMVVRGKVKGVITADVALNRLGREVARLSVGMRGYAFLISGQGAFLAAPQPGWIMRETIFSLAERLKRPDMRALGRRMIRGAAGVVDIRDWYRGEKSWLAFHPVKGPGWSLGVMLPEGEVLAPTFTLARHQLLAAGVGLLVMVAVVWLLVMGLTRPLKYLAAGARRLASGDLNTRVERVRPGDEVGEVAQAFNSMVEDLNRYVEELTATTAAKERIESELDLANQIQQSILPRIYPPFPERAEFDLAAINIPARMVGGDFFNFFFVDPDHLGLVVGDVSGKGIPAALFMTVSNTLIKNAAQHHQQPAAVLEEVNGQIEPDNEMCMFVTVFYAVYEISSGRLVYVSAGHPAPLLRRASGQVEQIPALKGSAVGILPRLDLEQGEITLERGDLLLVFTDGLDEAVNQEEEMFGIQRAAQWLVRAEVGPGPEMIQDLVEHHRRFTGPVEPFDDLTLLIFRRKQ